MADETAPKTKINSFFNLTIKNSRGNKIIKILFRLFKIFVALDFGFTKFNSRKMNITVKCICLCQGSFLCFVFCYYFWTLKTFMFMWYSLYTLQYFNFVIISAFSNVKLYDFLYNVISIDAELKVNSESYSITAKFLFVCVILIGYRTILPYFYCTSFLEYCIPSLFMRGLYLIPIISIHIVLIVFAFIFYAAYCRLYKFTNFIENYNFEVPWCLNIYKTLVDATGNINNAFTPMFVVTLLCNLLDVMFTIYYSLIVTYSGKSANNYLMSYISMAEILLLLFLPAFTAGTLSSQCEKLRLVLYDKLLQETDRQRADDIDSFIFYIEARPFNFTVAKIIPLDWSLPVTMLNITVTYLIVMIQLLHLY